MARRSQADELQTIPGVGPSIADDLRALGIRRVDDLRDRDPERLYARLGRLNGPQDRCLLYVFRCAVYYASTVRPKPEKLQWWVWKDSPATTRGRRPSRAAS